MNKYLRLLVAGLIILIAASACGKADFVGNEQANYDMWTVEYSTLNTTKIHEMELKAGTEMNVVLSNQAGELDVLVTDAAGNTIYEGNNVGAEIFSITIPADGNYHFSITGVEAQGSVSFTPAE
jgi:hypothetical protein